MQCSFARVCCFQAFRGGRTTQQVHARPESRKTTVMRIAFSLIMCALGDYRFYNSEDLN